MSHAAFARKPTQHVGVLRCDTFEPLTLQGALLEVEVLDVAARITASFEFRNQFSSPVSVFSAFRKIPGWTVQSISAVSGNRWAKSAMGQVESVAAAAPETEAFVAQVITQSIPFELLVFEYVTITAVFICDVETVAKDHLRLRVPQDVFPTRIEPDSTARDYNAKFEVKGTNKLARAIFANFRGTLLDDLSEPPHLSSGGVVKGQSSKNGFSLQWESHSSNLAVAEDLVLELRTQPSRDPVKVDVWKDIAAAQAEGPIPSSHTFGGVISLSPTFTSGASSHHHDADVPNDEVIFVLDRSASVAPYWAEVLRAVRIAVAALPPTTYVNVAWYSDTTELLFPNGSELLSDSIRDLIVEHVLSFELKDVTPNVNKLYQALQFLYKQPYITGFVRNMILLTDGGAEAHLDARCVDVARSNVHSTRFSTVAVGPYADVVFLRSIAAEASGFAEIAPAGSQDVAEGVMSILKRVHVPTLVHVGVRAEYDGNTPAPVQICGSRDHLPCIPKGGRQYYPFFGEGTLQQFTIVASGMLGLHHVEYKAQSSDVRSLQHQSMTEAGRPETASVLHSSAAIKRIEKLISGHSRSALTPEERSEVVALSRSFFVPSSVSTPAETSSTVVLPIAAGALFVNPKFARKANLSAARHPASIPRDPSGLRRVDLDIENRSKVLAATAASEDAQPIADFFRHVILYDVVRLVAGDVTVDDVLLAQTTDGSFRPGARFFSGLGLSEERALARQPGDVSVLVWSTALAVAFLEETSDKHIGAVAGLALAKAKAFLQHHGAESTILTAKRAFQH